MRRVVVTGLGIVSSIGNNANEVLASLREAKSGGPQWTSAAAVAPLPGTWTLTLNVALDASDAYTTSASYQVW